MLLKKGKSLKHVETVVKDGFADVKGSTEIKSTDTGSSNTTDTSSSKISEASSSKVKLNSQPRDMQTALSERLDKIRKSSINIDR